MNKYNQMENQWVQLLLNPNLGWEERAGNFTLPAPFGFPETVAVTFH